MWFFETLECVSELLTSREEENTITADLPDFYRGPVSWRSAELDRLGRRTRRSRSIQNVIIVSDRNRRNNKQDLRQKHKPAQRRMSRQKHTHNENSWRGWRRGETHGERMEGGKDVLWFSPCLSDLRRVFGDFPNLPSFSLPFLFPFPHPFGRLITTWRKSGKKGRGERHTRRQREMRGGREGNKSANSAERRPTLADPKSGWGRSGGVWVYVCRPALRKDVIEGNRLIVGLYHLSSAAGRSRNSETKQSAPQASTFTLFLQLYMQTVFRVNICTAQYPVFYLYITWQCAFLAVEAALQGWHFIKHLNSLNAFIFFHLSALMVG